VICRAFDADSPRGGQGGGEFAVDSQRRRPLHLDLDSRQVSRRLQDDAKSGTSVCQPAGSDPAK
jgi:hypothetical protein